MNFYDRLEKISNYIDEVVWQARRFARTGDWFAIYAITGIKRFKELSTLEHMMDMAAAQGRNFEIDIAARKASVEYVGKLTEVYNDRRFFWMPWK